MPDEIKHLLESGMAPLTSGIALPTAFDTIGVSEIENSEIQKIVDDVVDSLKCCYTSVAAYPNTEFRANSIESLFAEAFNDMESERRESIHNKAVELTSFDVPSKKAIFGRYGEVAGVDYLGIGFDRADDRFGGIKALNISSKLLGVKEPMIAAPISSATVTADGLLLPVTREGLPTGLEEPLDALGAGFKDAMESAKKSELSVDPQKFNDIWGPTIEEDLFASSSSEFEEEFEEQAVRNSLGFYIKRIKCIDETGKGWIGEWGHDEIAIGGVSTDEDGDTKKIPEKFVGGGFDDGDSKSYTPHLQFTWFSLNERKEWPKKYYLTLLLAEKDWGGFSKILSQVWEKVRDKVKDALAKLGESIGSAWGAIWKAIGKAIGVIVGWIIDVFLKWLIKLFSDDPFKPVLLSCTLWSASSLFNHADGSRRTYSPTRTAHFYGNDGHYTAEYYWKLY